MVINMEYKIITNDERETIELAQNIESEKKICVENTYLKNENYNPLNSYERI